VTPQHAVQQVSDVRSYTTAVGNAASDPRLRIGANLANDARTGAVVSALRAVGADPLVLKGASVRELLYGSNDERVSEDVDLLVSEEELDAVEKALPELGFVFAGVSALGHGRAHSRNWADQRTETMLEVHTRIPGVGSSDREAWNVLASDADTMQIGGHTVRILSMSGCVFHVVLHAAQHGRDSESTMRDLERAIERIPLTVWQDAAVLADQLSSLPAFASGLRLHQKGDALLDRLGVDARPTTELALRAESTVPLARGVEWLSRLPTTSQRARFLLRAFAPPPASMRQWSALARRGPAGLAAAYASRPVWIVVHAAPAIAAWLRARRAAGG
jgi:hypothetical protein